MNDNGAEPIKLLAADTGEVMALACPYCRNVASQGHAWGGYKPNDPDRRVSIGTLGHCCRCDCGALIGPLGRRECETCAAKAEPARAARRVEQTEIDASDDSDAAEFDAFLRRRLATWDGFPLVVTHASDGYGIVAFPLACDEMPSDVTERLEAMPWFGRHDDTLFGRGTTPEEALSNLRARAAEVQNEKP